MDEFKFVIRCLLFTGLIMFVSQYKINDETLESKAQYFFVESGTAEKLRQVASGGVLAVRNSVESGLQFLNKKMARNDGGGHHEPTRNKSEN
jgi:hypothetical protein